MSFKDTVRDELNVQLHGKLLDPEDLTVEAFTDLEDLDDDDAEPVVIKIYTYVGPDKYGFELRNDDGLDRTRLRADIGHFLDDMIETIWKNEVKSQLYSDLANDDR